MRIFGFLDQKWSKKNQILSQIFDCYGVIKRFRGGRLERSWAPGTNVIGIPLRRNSKQILAEFVFIFVEKINKNPKIRIKLIYCFFDFFQKLS